MRISSKLYYDIAQQSMTRSASAAVTWQKRLASGLRIDRASDDPAAAGRSVILSTRLSRIDMLKANQDFAQANLADLDTALDAMQTQLSVLREVTVQARNGALNSAGYQALSFRANQSIEELTKNALQTDSSGRPLFNNDEAVELEVQSALDVSILLGRAQVFGTGDTLETSQLMTAVNGIKAAIEAERAPDGAEVEALSDAIDRLSSARTLVGLNTVAANNARESVEAYQLGVLQEKSELVDTDVAVGVSEFSKAQTMLETARSLFARIDTSGLFGLLR